MVSAILVLPYIPDSPEVIVAAGVAVATASTAFSSMLLLSLFHFYNSFNSECVIW